MKKKNIGYGRETDQKIRLEKGSVILERYRNEAVEESFLSNPRLTRRGTWNGRSKREKKNSSFRKRKPAIGCYRICNCKYDFICLVAWIENPKGFQCRWRSRLHIDNAPISMTPCFILTPTATGTSQSKRGRVGMIPSRIRVRSFVNSLRHNLPIISFWVQCFQNLGRFLNKSRE